MNDAPALKRADIGIAMGITGTDVSKQAADMVLTDDNYVSIVSAIEQGRIIYSNIRKFVYFLISCNMAEIAIIFIATLLGWPSPLTVIQLLWLNLLSDGAPALALGLEKGDPDIMERAPRPPKEPVINRDMVAGVVVQTVAITAAVLLALLARHDGLRRTGRVGSYPDGGDDGVCYVGALGAAAGLHRAVGAPPAPEAGGVQQQVDAVCRGFLHRAAAGRGLCAVPSAYLQHHPVESGGVDVDPAADSDTISRGGDAEGAVPVVSTRCNALQKVRCTCCRFTKKP